MKRTRLKPVSDKRQKQNAAYEKAKRQWRKQHDGRCEMLFRVDDDGRHARTRRNALPSNVLIRAGGDEDTVFRCHRRAERSPHHSKRRGKFLCDITTFLGLCRSCHDWTHEHPNKARELGYLIRP